MAGLLDNTDSLAQEILSRWGQYGEWDSAGVNRAQELADLLRKQGVTSLGNVELKKSNVPFTEQERAALVAKIKDAQFGGPTQSATPDPMNWAADQKLLDAGGYEKSQLSVGGKDLGYLGNYNNDGSYGTGSSQYMDNIGGGDPGSNNLLAWSATGHGNTGWTVQTGPDGQPVVVPSWGSSSDADTARTIAKMAAVAGTLGYAGAAAAGAGAAGGAGAGSGLTAAQQAAFASPELMGGAFGTGAQLGTAEYAAMAGAGAGAGGGYVSPELMGGSFGPGSAQLGTAEYGAGGIGSAFGNPEAVGGSFGPGSEQLGTKGLVSGAGNGTWNGTDFTGPAAKAAGTGLLSGGVGDLAKLGITALGAYEGYKGNDPATTANTRTLDPRIDSRVFGDGGLMSNVDSWYQQNKSGQNEQMKKSQEWLRGMLSSPEAQQGLARMYGSSQGLLSQPVAGNPFLNWKVGG